MRGLLVISSSLRELDRYVTAERGTPEVPRKGRHPMHKIFKSVLLAGSLAGTLALAACGGDDSASADGGDANTLNIVGYSVLEQANAGVISAFQDSDAGKDVEFKESYGASGDQARAVIAGQDADEVHLSLEPDVQKLVDEGLVADDWKDNDT